METKHITRVGPLSLAKFLGCLYSFIGLIIGSILAVFALLGAAIGAGSSGSGVPWIGAFLGVGAIVALPILYGKRVQRRMGMTHEDEETDTTD